MKAINLALAIVLMASNVLAESNKSEDAIDVLAIKPPVNRVNAQLVVDSITEVELLGLARIENPRIVFDSDIGFGLTVPLNAFYEGPRHFAYVGDWVCKEMGYGRIIEVVNGPKTAEFVADFRGDPRDLSMGIHITKANVDSHFATRISCEM